MAYAQIKRSVSALTQVPHNSSEDPSSVSNTSKQQQEHLKTVLQVYSTRKSEKVHVYIMCVCVCLNEKKKLYYSRTPEVSNTLVQKIGLMVLLR